MTVSVDVVGLPELKKYMKEKKKAITDGMETGIKRASLYLHGKVKESIARGTNAPVAVDTGRFLNSVDIESIGKDNAKIFTDLSYAKFVEYGTSRMQARPHFQNTKAKEGHHVIKIIKDQIEKDVNKIVGKTLGVGKLFK